MKNKAKTSNATKSHSELSKMHGISRYGSAKYFDYWKKVSMDEKLDQLIEFMTEYFSNPKNTDIYSGVLTYGMPQATYESWLKRSPDRDWETFFQ